MTTTYDPHDPQYLDETDLRGELDRVYDLCHGCRLCFNLCPSFPTLFSLIDDVHDGAVHDLTPDEQDQVVDECYQCKLCYVKCPYVPPHEWQLDFPRLMMRAHAVGASKPRPFKQKVTDQFLGRTDLLGRLSSTAAPVVNAITGRTGSLARKAMQATVGIHAERLLPPYARQRFTSWFKHREPVAVESPRAEVSVFPTCFVEYMEPAIGKDIVGVLEHNGFACSLPAGTRCCGAPWLHQGEVAQFTEQAKRNVAALAVEVRAGRDVIVAQPTCAYVLKKDYPIYVGGADAALVAAHTFDPAEYLLAAHRGEGGPLDTDFPGEVPEHVAYHLACHLRAQNIGARARDLLALAGMKVTLIERCSGIDGTWGYRAENYDLARKVARPLAREVQAAGADAVCGDCHLANTAIRQETGAEPVHPITLFARAYGLPES
ncbi:MAG TPA: heterodisulfide reductase-related iron-sulfur binding cluster [Acidimicrobiales bacterium]|nr:heterodisulfide reductase-related iron-sulfur binding cluster [Acidimicrobiales bacterium]